MLSSVVFSQIFVYFKMASDLIGNLSLSSIVFGNCFPQWIRQKILHYPVIWELPFFVWLYAVVMSVLLS